MPTPRSPRAVVTGAVLILALVGCGHSAASNPGDTVRRLGAVPIPTPPPAAPTPLADSGHPQLLAMGAPVAVVFDSGRGLLVATGPTEDSTTSAPPANTVPDEVFGTFALHLTADQGSLAVSVADLSSRDQSGRVVPLSPAGAAPGAVVATPGRPATLTVRGVFRSGSAQLTLRHAGRVIAVWDFSVELD